jgi:prevent-host-death family protein
VDLQGGVVPISKAASALAALLKRSRAQQQPIIVTQKGYPTGVILDVELYTRLRALAARSGAINRAPSAEGREGTPAQIDARHSLEDNEPPLQTAATSGSPAAFEAAEAEAAPVRRSRGGRRNKMQAEQS